MNGLTPRIITRGLVLPKAEDFDRAHYHETEREFNGAGFCVDASGAVTSVR